MKPIGIDLGYRRFRFAAAVRSSDPIAERWIEGVVPVAAAVRRNDKNECETNLLLGWHAEKQRMKNPEDVVSSITRLLSSNEADLHAKEFIQNLSCRTANSRFDPQELLFRLGDQALTPLQITAKLLHKLRMEAEIRLGERVNQAAISVPASFDTRQCDAVRQAAASAGFSSICLIESHVAVLEAAPKKPELAGKILIYDFGAETFSFSIIELDSMGNRRVLATGGDPWLGGRQLDDAISERVIHFVKESTGLDLSNDDLFCATAKFEAEKAKIALSKLSSVHVSFLAATRSKKHDPVEVNLEISRDRFVNDISSAIDKTIQLVKNKMDEERLELEDISIVLAVGGCTNIPAIQSRLQRTFGEDKICFVDEPNRTLARGAASFANDWFESEPASNVETNKQELHKKLEMVRKSYDASAGATMGAALDDERLEPTSDVKSVSPTHKLSQLDENVQFTVYRPKTLRPEVWQTMLAFAHLDELPVDAAEDEVDPIEEVKRQAEAALGPKMRQYKQAVQDSRSAVPKGSELRFMPDVEGCEFNPPVQSVRWLESVHKTEFRVRACRSLDGSYARGRVSVFLGAILLADIPITMKVDSRASTGRSTEAETAKQYRKIFASYSHEDLAIVEQFERFAETLGDRYLRDWKDLRSGENWDDRLMAMIEEADVFQLFWSTNSMRSPFVRREWEHAISLVHKGPNFVRPTYWETPMPKSDAEGLPPADLGNRHFTCLAQPLFTEVAKGTEVGSDRRSDLPRTATLSSAPYASTEGQRRSARGSISGRIDPKKDARRSSRTEFELSHKKMRSKNRSTPLLPIIIGITIVLILVMVLLVAGFRN